MLCEERLRGRAEAAQGEDRTQLSDRDESSGTPRRLESAGHTLERRELCREGVLEISSGVLLRLWLQSESAQAQGKVHEAGGRTVTRLESNKGSRAARAIPVSGSWMEGPHQAPGRHPRGPGLSVGLN